MIFLKTEDEIELMRNANQLVGKTLAEVARAIQPGVTTKQLNTIADTFIRDNGALPTFLDFPNPYGQPFPASICTSVNSQVVHGIPTDIALAEGDIVSVDCGVMLEGFCGDSCYTFCVGEVSDGIKSFLDTVKTSLYCGIEQAIAGNRIGHIGDAVQTICEAKGYGIVREFVGHGIGRKMHEDPQVPNYGRRGNGTLLKKGMCIAIEPMVTMGSYRVAMGPDKWTVCTIDGSLAAHYEHTIAVRNGRADILSSFEEIEEVLNKRS